MSDETWVLIKSLYEKGGEFLSPTTKIMIENLLASLQVNRTITSSYEADLIITLLLYCSQSPNEATEDEDKQHTHSPTKDNWYEDSTNLTIRINQVIEQLRLFCKGIEAHTIDCFKEQSR